MSVNLSSAKVGIQGPSGSVAASTPIESQPAATGLQSTDTILVVQGGALVAATVDQVRGNAAVKNTNAAGTTFKIFDDFTLMNVAQTANTSMCEGTSAITTLSGTGSQATQKASSEFVPGVLSLETGTTTSGIGAAAINAVSILFFATNPLKFTTRFKIPTLSDVTNQFEVRMGLMTALASAPTNGFYLKAAHGQTFFQCVNMVASTPTTTTTTVAIDTSYHTYQVEWNGTTCYHRIDGTLVATQAQKPADLTGLIGGAGIYKAASTTTRAVYLDWWQLEVFTGSRGLSVAL